MENINSFINEQDANDESHTDNYLAQNKYNFGDMSESDESNDEDYQEVSFYSTIQQEILWKTYKFL